MVLRRDPAPSIGQLKTKVLLQAKTSAASGGSAGTGMSESYLTIGKASCSLVSTTGGRYIAGMQVEEGATHRVHMRYRDDFDQWRFLLAGTTRYKVLSISDPDKRRRWLVALVEEMKL